VYSFGSDAQQGTAGMIFTRIVMQIQLTGGDIELIDSLSVMASPTYNVGDRAQEPSMSLRPRGVPPRAFPTLIAEIAHQNWPWKLVLDKLLRWMGPNTTVQVAIGIRIFPTSNRRSFVLM